MFTMKINCTTPKRANCTNIVFLVPCECDGFYIKTGS